MFLRDLVTTLLYKKQWSDFHAPVVEEEAPGYGKTVRDPMDLSTLLWRVDSGWYLTVDAFLRDARLIVTAAKAYWGGLGESAAEKSAHAATREAAARRAEMAGRPKSGFGLADHPMSGFADWWA